MRRLRSPSTRPTRLSRTAAKLRGQLPAEAGAGSDAKAGQHGPKDGGLRGCGRRVRASLAPPWRAIGGRLIRRRDPGRERSRAQLPPPPTTPLVQRAREFAQSPSEDAFGASLADCEPRRNRSVAQTLACTEDQDLAFERRQGGRGTLDAFLLARRSGIGDDSPHHECPRRHAVDGRPSPLERAAPRNGLKETSGRFLDLFHDGFVSEGDFVGLSGRGSLGDAAIRRRFFGRSVKAHRIRNPGKRCLLDLDPGDEVAGKDPFACLGKLGLFTLA